MYCNVIKRVLDFLFALVGLIVLSPLLLVVWGWLTISNKGAGAIFTQKRLGKDSKVFKLIKFKSMTDERDAEGRLLPDEERVTKTGAFLRRYKIDELLQLLNVLKGDMSIVGPRPCLPELKEEFDENAFVRLKVKPGLTGLAQVNGNIYLSWNERWRFDREYVDSCTFILDMKIILKTVLIVIFGEGKFKA